MKMNCWLLSAHGQPPELPLKASWGFPSRQDNRSGTKNHPSTQMSFVCTAPSLHSLPEIILNSNLKFWCLLQLIMQHLSPYQQYAVRATRLRWCHSCAFPILFIGKGSDLLREGWYLANIWHNQMSLFTAFFHTVSKKSIRDRTSNSPDYNGLQPEDIKTTGSPASLRTTTVSWRMQ